MNRTWTATWDDPSRGIDTARRMSGMEYMRSIVQGSTPPPPFARLLGFELESVNDGEVTFALVPAEQHYNPFGVMHGGVAASLFDSALGCAIQTQLQAGRIAPTMQLDINYIRPVIIASGRIRCTGRVIHLGNRSATAEGRLVDMHGKLYAHATGRFVISELEELPTP